MTSVYCDADYLAVYKQKKKIFGVFWAVLAFYLAFCIAWLVFHISLPYNDPKQALAKGMVFVASALFTAFAFPYLAIKGSRIRRYYKLMGYLSDGMKNEEKNYFFAFERKVLQKDNIDVWGCMFETWSKKKQEWMDREAYWDNEKPLPELESGDFVKYIVQSNIIVQYEILEKKALEFELVDEDEEDDGEGYVPEDEETAEGLEESSENAEVLDETEDMKNA